MGSPPKVSGDKAREKQKNDAEQRARRHLHDLELVLDRPEGKRVMLRLLEEAGIHRQTFVPGEPDRSAFNEGRRHFGLWLLSELMTADTENFSLPVMKFRALEKGN